MGYRCTGIPVKVYRYTGTSTARTGISQAKAATLGRDLDLDVIVPRDDPDHFGNHHAVDHGPEDHEKSNEGKLRIPLRYDIAKADSGDDSVDEVQAVKPMVIRRLVGEAILVDPVLLI